MNDERELPPAEPHEQPQLPVVLEVPEIRRPHGAIRPLSWLLLFLFALTAVLGAQLRKPPELLHVAGTTPPVEAPTGALAEAFEQARAATVRIEARCAGLYHGQPIGVGTGFFVREDGLLLTAYHVVDAATSANCTVRWLAVTADMEEFPVSLVGFDAYMDLAALQASVNRAVPVVPLAQHLPTPGTPVVAIGNSRDEFLAARAGRVTRLGVQAGRADFADNTIELTNSLAPGDSGGPVVNSHGEAVGLVSYISFNPNAMSSQSFVPPYLRGLTLSRDFAGYAVPLTGSSELVAAVLAGERRDVPVIGFSQSHGLAYDYDPRTSAHDLGLRPGPIVGQVAVGGPAEAAGLRSLGQETVMGADGSVTLQTVADVIVAVDGVPTPTFFDLLAEVRGKQIGDVVELTVQRGRATFRVELTLGARLAVFAGN